MQPSSVASDTVAVYCYMTEAKNPGLRESDPHAFAIVVHSCTLDFLGWRIERMTRALIDTLKADDIPA
jgi:hypothetical protein